MSMLRHFFEDDRQKDGSRTAPSLLFAGLKISAEGEEYTDHMGRYPVIALTLKSAKQPGFDSAYAAMTDDIGREFDRHSFVLDADCLAEHEADNYVFCRIFSVWE